MDLFTDSPPHTLVRVSDPDTSKAAGATTPSGKSRKRVYDAVEASGEHGITLKEFSAKENVQMSSFSSRPSELEKMQYIHYRGDKRDGSRIMITMKHKTGYSLCECGMVLLEHYDNVCQVCK